MVTCDAVKVTLLLRLQSTGRSQIGLKDLQSSASKHRNLKIQTYIIRIYLNKSLDLSSGFQGMIYPILGNTNRRHILE